MHTYTSSEYWAGHGALVHIDLTGSRDLEVPESVRIYHFGGCQHPMGVFPLQDKDRTARRSRPAAVQLDRLPTAAPRRSGEPRPLGHVWRGRPGQPLSPPR